MKIVLLLISLLIISCTRFTDSINKRVDEVDGKLDVANEKLRLAVVQGAKTEMEKPENTKNLNPPVAMMGPGRAFATNANSTELLGVTLANYIDIERAKLNEQERVNGRFPHSVLNAFNHDKTVKIMEIRIVAGFAPQTVVESIVQNDIYGQSSFESTALMFLATRAAFISQILLGTLISEGLPNLGSYEVAVDYAQQLKYLAALPNQDKLIFQTTGIVDDQGISDMNANANDKVDGVEIAMQIAEVKRLFYENTNLASNQGRYASLKMRIDNL